MSLLHILEQKVLRIILCTHFHYKEEDFLNYSIKIRGFNCKIKYMMMRIIFRQMPGIYSLHNVMKNYR